MTRPLLLDLYCGAGGAAMGYHLAGFDVIGVDIRPQPRYPFRFIQDDAIDFLEDVVAGVDHAGTFAAVHASPPCQAYTSLRHRTGRQYPDLIGPTRALLAASGLPYVIENVPHAPLSAPLWLCGTEFGLVSGPWHLKRHRGFESNVMLMGAGGCSCAGARIGGVYGTGGGGRMTRGYKLSAAQGREAMGTPWMTWREMAQAIPPAFTHHVGEQLLAHLAVGVS